MRRIICLFRGHRWETSRFVVLGDGGAQQFCARCGAWRDHP